MVLWRRSRWPETETICRRYLDEAVDYTRLAALTVATIAWIMMGSLILSGLLPF